MCTYFNLVLSTITFEDSSSILSYTQIFKCWILSVALVVVVKFQGLIPLLEAMALEYMITRSNEILYIYS